MESTTTPAVPKAKAKSMPDPNPESNFTLFPKLPIELRLSIWRHALPGPRTIEVFLSPRPFRTGCGRLYSPPPPPRPQYWITNSKLPTILAVNHESRTEAKKSYAMISGPHRFHLAFNNAIDTKLMCNRYSAHWLSADDCDDLEELSVVLSYGGGGIRGRVGDDRTVDQGREDEVLSLGDIGEIWGLLHENRLEGDKYIVKLLEEVLAKIADREGKASVAKFVSNFWMKGEKEKELPFCGRIAKSNLLK
ncbi:uncharacterized protein PAC_16507 [Phialocephala subalpina]|uniref:2EXR domain-containing protein n=1 Tax=Phialocephala subalpina TaxID=576137 RepID=A0A1L7XNV0_9HELO|nr:uncharacterized protein PAC_16507 [Phialocephala subalpina]